MESQGTKVFLVVGFDGLPELLTQYNPEGSSTFIFQNNHANRFFVEEVLREKNSLPVYGFPTNSELFLLDGKAKESQSVAFQDFDRDGWISLMRIPEFAEQIRIYLTSLGPISEIVWYNRMDLWVLLVLGVAQNMGIPILRVTSERDANQRFHFWDNEDLRKVNPKLAGLIDQLNSSLPQQQLLADIHLTNCSYPVFSGISPVGNDLRHLMVSLQEVVESQRQLRRLLGDRSPGEWKKSGNGILFVDDGISVEHFGYNWPSTAEKIKKYFSQLPREVPVSIKLRRVPPEYEDAVKEDLIELFPSDQRIDFAPSLMPAELMMEDFDTVFFVMSSCMVWPFKSRRISLFRLLSVERESSHSCFEAWIKHWKSLARESLILSDGKSVIKDLTT